MYHDIKEKSSVARKANQTIFCKLKPFFLKDFPKSFVSLSCTSLSLPLCPCDPATEGYSNALWLAQGSTRAPRPPGSCPPLPPASPQDSWALVSASHHLSRLAKISQQVQKLLGGDWREHIRTSCISLQSQAKRDLETFVGHWGGSNLLLLPAGSGAFPGEEKYFMYYKAKCHT